MQTFCTIITVDHLPHARTLHQSLIQQDPNALLQVLVTEDNINAGSGSFICHTISSLKGHSYFSALATKYATSSDYFRWSLKPIFIDHLLKQYQQVIYLDCDIHFFADPSFLFRELEEHTLLLTPHWPGTEPMRDEESFMMSFKTGMFNAGFIGAASGASEVLHWLASACLYNMSRDPGNGFFDDQRYLDMLPVLNEKTKILRHRGCNLGSWNIKSNQRSMAGGNVMINGTYPVVFIHFNIETVKQIVNKNDALLRPYLDKYIKLLAENGLDLLKTLGDSTPAKYDTALYKLRHKVRLRTRLKQFLYKLSEKL